MIFQKGIKYIRASIDERCFRLRCLDKGNYFKKDRVIYKITFPLQLSYKVYIIYKAILVKFGATPTLPRNGNTMMVKSDPS